MTLAQLHSFVLVARLGSVKAAAAELEVTEPAVSVAVAALRRHPVRGASATIVSVPFLRSRLLIIAAPGHPLAGRREIAPSELGGERWLVGQPDLDPTTSTGLFFARHDLAPPALSAYTSE